MKKIENMVPLRGRDSYLLGYCCGRYRRISDGIRDALDIAFNETRWHLGVETTDAIQEEIEREVGRETDH